MEMISQNLIAPILKKKADIVVGQRPIAETEHFSVFKKLLERIGSWLVRKLSRTNVQDAPSGFRAYSREAAMHIRVFNNYTYTLETIIQAGQLNMAIMSVPIRTNKMLRKSRLFKNIFTYIRNSIITMFRIFVTYQPFPFFMLPGISLSFLGLILFIRFLYYYVIGNGGGHIQSLVLGGSLTFGIILILIGILGRLNFRQ